MLGGPALFVGKKHILNAQEEHPAEAPRHQALRISAGLWGNPVPTSTQTDPNMNPGFQTQDSEASKTSGAEGPGGPGTQP